MKVLFGLTAISHPLPGMPPLLSVLPPMFPIVLAGMESPGPRDPWSKKLHDWHVFSGLDARLGRSWADGCGEKSVVGEIAGWGNYFSIGIFKILFNILYENKKSCVSTIAYKMTRTRALTRANCLRADVCVLSYLGEVSVVLSMSLSVATVFGYTLCLSQMSL